MDEIVREFRQLSKSIKISPPCATCYKMIYREMMAEKQFYTPGALAHLDSLFMMMQEADSYASAVKERLMIVADMDMGLENEAITKEELKGVSQRILRIKKACYSGIKDQAIIGRLNGAFSHSDNIFASDKQAAKAFDHLPAVASIAILSLCMTDCSAGTVIAFENIKDIQEKMKK